MRILVFCPTYLPSCRGGTVRAVEGLVAHLGRDFDFHVVARDRDEGEAGPYPGVVPGRWQCGERARLYYASPRSMPYEISRIARSVDPDAYYLNSFFSPTFTTWPILLRWLEAIPSRPVVLAPRGELHPAALHIRRAKKAAFLELARRLPAYSGVVWQAGTADEAQNIRSVLPKAEIRVARDLTALVGPPDTRRPQKKPGALSVAYVSRITPMKNLTGALRMLGRVTGDILFRVYGSCSEHAYLVKCQDEARRLPPNVRVRFEGEIGHERVLDTLSACHAFLLPTFGESFGHAVLEALLAGCTLIISDRTPWRHLERAGAGWDLALDDEGAFVEALQQCVDMDDGEFAQRWSSARLLGASAATSQAAIDQNRALFSDLGRRQGAD